MEPHCVCVLFLLAVSCIEVSSIVGGREAAVPPEDDPVIVVLREDHDATVYGLREKKGGFYSFRGLRYAEPPVGRFRFQRSRRLRLEGEVNATGSGDPCPQTDPNGGGIIGNEDCLFLNVFSAELPDGGEGLPVVVWIHGGGFRRGSASQYGPKHLVDKKVVVVTIQYRLGSLGFLSTGLLESPGNVALFDMALALEWVNEYINFFGGNPKKVTVSGQDTGASAAIMLSLSNSTSGYISGVIAMSGSAISTFAVDTDPTQTCRDLAADNACPTSPPLAMVRCLQQLPVNSIIAADSNLQSVRMEEQGIVSGLGGLISVAPVVDGEKDKRFLPTFVIKSPLDLLSSGMMPGVPLLTGVTKDQTSTAILGDLRTQVEDRIKSIPGFFDSVVKNLVKNSMSSVVMRPIELTSAITKTYFNLLPLGGGSSEDIRSSVKKIVEASGDALFNLPAFQTARLWGQKAPAFFYSFDYQGKKKGGPAFLRDCPLTQFSGRAEDSQGVGHGDDLLFLFDSQSLDGRTSEESLELDDPEDVKVRDAFTTLIADFARTGAPQVPSNDPNERQPWPAFSGDGFVSISEKPSVGKDFRYCEMALWAGLGERLVSATCQALEGIKELSAGVLNTLGVGNMGALVPIDGVGKAVNNLPALGDAGSVLKPNTIESVNPLGKLGAKTEDAGKVGVALGGGAGRSLSRSNPPSEPAANTNRQGGGGILGGGGSRSYPPSEPAANTNRQGGGGILGGGGSRSNPPSQPAANTNRQGGGGGGLLGGGGFLG